MPTGAQNAFEITPAKTIGLYPVSAINTGSNTLHLIAYATTYDKQAGGCQIGKPVSWARLSVTSATIEPGQSATTKATLDSAKAPHGKYDLSIVWETVGGHHAGASGVSEALASQELIQNGHGAHVAACFTVHPKATHSKTLSASLASGHTGLPMAPIGGASLVIVALLGALAWRATRHKGTRSAGRGSREAGRHSA